MATYTVNNIYFDNIRKNKIRINDYVKIRDKFYHIKDIEELIHGPEALGSVTSGNNTTYDFSTYLNPTDGYLYFIEFFAIDGLCSVRFQFPKGTTHLHPHNYSSDYIVWWMAHPTDPMFLPFICSNNKYPSMYVYNGSAVTNNTDAYFWGEKWLVNNPLDESDIPPGATVHILHDYNESGNMGAA